MVLKEIFLASFFSGEGHANETTGLQIGVSKDGREFWNISDTTEPIYTPENGLRDPHMMFQNGDWYLVHSHGPNLSPVLFLLKSKDLKSWAPVCRLRLDEDIPGGNNYIDVPSWVEDENGQVHIIACVDHNHHWVELHPLDDDPETWGDACNWSPAVEIADSDGGFLIQGNTFIDRKDGIFYMAFNEIDGSNFYMRTSKNLVFGWSLPQKINTYSQKNATESENLLFLRDGVMRFYVSCSNVLQYKMWYVESKDMGVTWDSPVMLSFHGFNHRVNWTQVMRITNPDAIRSLRNLNLGGVGHGN